MSISALHALLSGVRNGPRESAQCHGNERPAGRQAPPLQMQNASSFPEKHALPGLVADARRLPPALDFFAARPSAGDGPNSVREQNQATASASGKDRRTSGRRARGGQIVEDAQVNREKGRARKIIDCVDEDQVAALMQPLAARLAGHVGVARALIALGAGVPTQVQDRAMAYILGCAADVAVRGQGTIGGIDHGDNRDATVPAIATAPAATGPSRDLIAVAPTGSGKTLCYAAPLCAFVDMLRAKQVGAVVRGSARRAAGGSVIPAPVALVLVPTRELAVQVAAVFTRLSAAARIRVVVTVLASKAALAALGGGGGSSVVARLDVVIATPQRCAVALDRRLIDLGAVHHVVLDEADRLLDDGFIAQADAVLAACGTRRRIHAFSATMPPSTEGLLRGLCADPVKVVVGGGSYGGSAAIMDVAKAITQRFLFVGGRGEQGKVLAVRAMLKEGLMPPVLVFVQSKERAADLFRELIYDGIDVDAIHGDRSGAARSSAIARFRAGALAVLIATDLLARGLDFMAVATVINYDFPTSPSSYVHRIGRTGRNGRHGTAVTLFTEEDAELICPVARVALASGCPDVPPWMLTLGSGRRDRDAAKRLEKRPPNRQRVGGPSIAKLSTRRRRAKVPGNSNGDRVSRGVEKKISGGRKRARQSRSSDSGEDDD